MFKKCQSLATVVAAIAVTAGILIPSSVALADDTLDDVEIIHDAPFSDPTIGLPEEGWTSEDPAADPVDPTPVKPIKTKPPTDFPDVPYCEPNSKRTYRQLSWSWDSFDSGTVKNKSAKATAHKTVLHSSNEELTTTWSGETSLTLKATIAEINLKLGYSAATKVAYTTSTSFTVDVPPKTTVKFKDGIIRRVIQQKSVQMYSNCKENVKIAIVRAAESYSVIS